MSLIKTTVQLAGLAALPLFFSAPHPQTGQPPPRGEYDWREQWPGRRSSESERLQLTKGLQGLWKMTELDVPGRFVPEQAEVGYLLVSGSHLSMEIHGGWFEETSTDPTLRGDSSRDIMTGLTQSGIHSFEINEWGKLVTRSLIGAKSTVDGQYEFEPPRTVREYELDLSGSRLILRRADGRALIFQRLRETRRRTDIFGRPAADEVIEDLPREPVKRDIYGRPIEEPQPEEPPVEQPEDERP